MMNKDDFKRLIAGANNVTLVEAEKAIEMVISGIKDALVNNGGVGFLNFGSFEVITRDEHKGRNPQTGVELMIPECKVPKFKYSKTLKKAVNN